jgi:outer membrane protein
MAGLPRRTGVRRASRHAEPRAANRGRRRAGSIAIGIVGALIGGNAPGAQEGFDGWGGQFQLLLRGVWLEPQNRSASQSSAQLHLDGGLYGELSAAWFMTPDFSMELSLGQVSSFDSHLEGGQASVTSGPISIQPYTWTLQYGLAPGSSWRVYVGAGLHYTSLSIHPPGSEVLTIESSQHGWVLQAGTDLRIAGGWFANADVRYLGGLEPVITMKQPPQAITGYINPLLLSAGIGFRW